MRGRTAALETALDQARAASSQVLLTGPGVHDLLIDAQGRALWLVDAIRSHCARRGLGLVFYRLGVGAQSLPTLRDGGSVALRPGPAEELPDETITRVIQDLRSAAVPSVLLLDYLDSVLPAEGLAAADHGRASLLENLRCLTADAKGWQRHGLQAVLVDRSDSLPAQLRNQPGYRTITVDPPDQTERVLFVRRRTESRRVHALRLDGDVTVERAARVTGGLLLRDLHELAVSSNANPVTVHTLAALKASRIQERSGGALELLNCAGVMDDIAGLPGLRLYLSDLRLAGRGSVRICLAGPPGTGKTYAAQRIAGFLGVPLVRFGQVHGSLLGESESNMRRALSLLCSMAPVTVLIDEADQGPLGARDGSGRTGNEAHLALRAMLFEFLSDPNADDGISVVATTNVPQRLDPAARSRFSAFLPVLFGSGPELAKIMAMHARRQPEAIPIDGDHVGVLTRFVAAGGVLSGRSAQSVLESAWRNALRAGERVVRPEDIETALALRANQDWNAATEYSTLSALSMAPDASVLPWIAAQLLGESYDPPARLQAYLTPSGAVDIGAVQTRIHELETAGVYR